MKQPETMTIQILDKEYCIACPPEERINLQKAADYLDKTMKEIRSTGKTVGVERIAVTAALNITYKLLAKQQIEDDSQQKLL